ncbi:MAG: hypothetical protein HRT57_05550 [Crocinitomicaceae bacterium]|nr:hypothetical protein [Crocinitomicaceae bacterium]
MKSLLLSLVVLCLCCISNNAIGQSTSVETSSLEKMASPGTYQIIVKKRKTKPVFTKDLLYLIESERKENEDVLFPLSELVDIFIPSLTTINDQNFVPLEQMIY